MRIHVFIGFSNDSKYSTSSSHSILIQEKKTVGKNEWVCEIEFVDYFREQDKFEQEERKQQELENIREDEMTPSEDLDTKPKHEDPLPLSEDLQQEMVGLSVQFTICLPSEDYSCEA